VAVQKTNGRNLKLTATEEKNTQEKVVGGASKEYAAAEFAKRNTEDTIWVIVNDQGFGWDEREC
jgi:hypothetical protein